ncbi:hypothetical protein PG994_001569 [Apiospora phragmitis]|uniref:Peroxisomal membrane protein PEX14-like KPWE domain-containing protein n=1 Tax=Apiospora phragmitis TaxID=2905665 RepID=A0ABR1WTV4_9PEZI
MNQSEVTASDSKANESLPPPTSAAPSGSANMDTGSNQSTVYRAFDSYPWSKDRIFQVIALFRSHLACCLVVETLSKELYTQHDSNPADIALSCRIKRFEDKVNIKVDPAMYQAYRDEGAKSQGRPGPPVPSRAGAYPRGDWGDVPADQIPYGQLSAPVDGGLTAPLWQLAAPKADLYVKRDDLDSGSGGKEPYPKKFEEIIEFLQSGKEIPGIQKIPDTVISDPSITTTTGRPVPLKPWEKRPAN